MAKIVDSLGRLSVKNGTKKIGKETLLNNVGEFTLFAEEVVSDNENYILSICGTQCDELEFRVGAALSDHSCIIYSIRESINRIAVLNHNKSPIVGIKFSSHSKNIIYTASEDGNITACDLRAKGKVVAEFKDNTIDVKLKPLASFDISCDERLLAGGTEHIGGDAFILFWDIRSSNSKVSSKNHLLGGYWESHMDDVTCLAFHQNKRDVLASGSTDGLINVFDLKQSSEDSALQYSLNTESSVDRIGWLNSDNMWCTTHTHSLQLWNCEDATPYRKYDREDLPIYPNEDPENCYLVRIHVPHSFGHPFLLTGSSTNKGEILKCLSLEKNKLEPYHKINGNKQIVRDSWLHEKTGCLISGGENGVLNIWRQVEGPLTSKNVNIKRSLKIGVDKSRSDKNHRIKPY